MEHKDAWAQLDELKQEGEVEVTMQFRSWGDVYVAVSRKVDNIEDCEEGLLDCITVLRKLEFQRNLKNHNLEVVK